MFFEADTRKHQMLVAERMTACAKRLLDKASVHDASKFSDQEREIYTETGWKLNHENIEYGSEEYKKIVAEMGKAWEHHQLVNDHHIGFFKTYQSQTLNDPVRAMDLFALIEMLCDWIAASKRKNNAPALAFKSIEEYIPGDSQLGAILRNTLSMIENLGRKQLKDAIFHYKQCLHCKYTMPENMDVCPKCNELQ